MTSKRWDFRDEDLRRYTVELEHGFWSGKRVIRVNGREVIRERRMFGFDMGSQHGFDMEGHAALLRIRTSGMTYAFDLYVDGIAIGAEGTTIPRPGPAISRPIIGLPQPFPAAAPVTAPVDPHSALEQRVRNGGRWFYWIAGLSAVNFVLFLLGTETGFALGTALDWFVGAILEEMNASSLAWMPHVAVISLFAFLGMRATAGSLWAFVVGGVIYLIDGLLFLLVKDWLGIAVHAFALFAIVSATISLRQLRSAPSRVTVRSV